VVSYNKLYLMNFRRWNYNCAFYYDYLIMEKVYKTKKSNILHFGKQECQRNINFKATVCSVKLGKTSISAKFTDIY
jgi:hypothetical protein